MNLVPGRNPSRGPDPNDDHFNPVGAPGAPPVGFTSGFSLFLRAGAQREMLSDNSDWQNTNLGGCPFANDASLERQITAANVACDFSENSVLNTLTSRFRVFSPSGAIDLICTLTQRVSVFDTSSAYLPQHYAITNNAAAAITIEMVRSFDGGLPWGRWRELLRE